MRMDRLLLGMDGGGTKTECVLCAENGEVLRVFRGPATNPNGQTAEQAADAMRKCLTGSLDGVGCDALTVFASVAGCSAPQRQEQLLTVIRDAMPRANARVAGDIVCALSAAFGAGRDGGIAIAGTGSACFARVNGEYIRTGGWGCLFGDAGSGFAIGRAALMAAMCSRDGTPGGSETLRQLCEEKLGCSMADGLTALYEGGRTLIASFAECAAEALRAGDGIAEEIVRTQAELLAQQILACAGHLRERTVACTGSIWHAFPLFTQTVRERCTDVRLLESRHPASYGAVLEAASDAGIAFDAAAQNRYFASYEHILQMEAEK